MYCSEGHRCHAFRRHAIFIKSCLFSPSPSYRVDLELLSCTGQNPRRPQARPAPTRWDTTGLGLQHVAERAGLGFRIQGIATMACGESFVCRCAGAQVPLSHMLLSSTDWAMIGSNLPARTYCSCVFRRVSSACPDLTAQQGLRSVTLLTAG